MRLVRRIAVKTPQVVGSPPAFLLALLLVSGWVAGGFAIGWTDTWLLWPSAIASVVTFLIAFSLQYTQNRDTRAIQLKLDEILRAHEGARTELVKLECFDDDELERVEDEIVELRDGAR
jgi:low affinity Fe/Cu permease